jgi:hypothetical protein
VIDYHCAAIANHLARRRGVLWRGPILSLSVSVCLCVRVCVRVCVLVCGWIWWLTRACVCRLWAMGGEQAAAEAERAAAEKAAAEQEREVAEEQRRAEVGGGGGGCTAYPSPHRPLLSACPLVHLCLCVGVSSLSLGRRRLLAPCAVCTQAGLCLRSAPSLYRRRLHVSRRRRRLRVSPRRRRLHVSRRRRRLRVSRQRRRRRPGAFRRRRRRRRRRRPRVWPPSEHRPRSCCGSC